MEMTKQQVARIATNLIKVIEENKLDNLKAITQIAERPLDPKADDKYQGEEIVQTSVQPSNKGTFCTISLFVRSDLGHPLRLHQCQCCQSNVHI